METRLGFVIPKRVLGLLFDFLKMTEDEQSEILKQLEEQLEIVFNRKN